MPGPIRCPWLPSARGGPVKTPSLLVGRPRPAGYRSTCHQAPHRDTPSIGLPAPLANTEPSVLCCRCRCCCCCCCCCVDLATSLTALRHSRSLWRQSVLEECQAASRTYGSAEGANNSHQPTGERRLHCRLSSRRKKLCSGYVVCWLIL